MFDSPFDPITQVLAIIFISLVLAIAAIVFARKAYKRVEDLRARLDRLEATRVPTAIQAVPPPLPQFEQAPPSAPGVAPQPALAAAEPEIAPPRTEPAASAAPPSLPPSLRSSLRPSWRSF